MLRTVLHRHPPLVRRLHVSPSPLYPRRRTIVPVLDVDPTSISETELEAQLLKRDETGDPDADHWDMDNVKDFAYDDLPNVGHHMLRQEREYVHYMRLIEIEGPQLAAHRRPFVPTSAPLRLRTISYGGEYHPAMMKAVVVVPVSSLPLKSAAAIHKFKLVAGPRWSPEPPTDGGISPAEHEKEGKEGYFKISCEDFQLRSMNAKWCSDMLDRLITESHRRPEKFANMPIDMRHINARERKSQRHHHPSIRDFPTDWIPKHLREQLPQSI